MKNKTIVMLAMIFSSSTMAAEHGFFCSNCSYEEAVAIATSEAAPTVHCVIDQTSTDDPVEQCSSLPKRFFVVNKKSRQIFPLVVFHKHQKSQRQLLTLATTNGALSTRQQQSILKALDAKHLLFPLLLEISDNLSQEANHNLIADPATALSRQTNTGVHHPDNSCNDDPHAQALENASSESYRIDLQLRARANFQQTLAKSTYKALKDTFKEWTFTALGMHGGAVQGGFDIRWEDNVRNYNFAETYTSANGSRSELIWGFTLTASDDLEVKLGSRTSSIGGWPLDALLESPTGSLPPKISTCLVNVLQQRYFAHTAYEQANEEQTQYFDDTPQMIGRNELRSGGWICKYSFLDHHKNLKMQYLSKCPLQ